MAEPFILCADDYGQNSAVSAGILELARVGRLSATSVMVNGAGWPGDAAGLAALAGGLAVGLHLNLTHGAPLGPMPKLAPRGRFPSLGGLIGSALMGRLDPSEIAGETDRQLDAFEAALGFAPDHLDGHQHVHTLPGIRSAVLSVLRRRYKGRPVLLRDPSDRLTALLRRPEAVKAAVVTALSAGFARQARAAGFLTNAGFAGFTDFTGIPYALLFEAFQARPGPAPMIMCHPGLAGSTDDPIAARRPQELQALHRLPGLERLIWHPQRAVPGAPLDWPMARGT
ncbi:ChbG/HpnK family deacetylase [bacterium]|nr:ChbG/HpnK family deacetylase [bacterium]